MNEEVGLKPCPFCGSTDLDYGIYLGTLRGFDYVECMNCGGKINAIHKPKLICAEELWNKRADEKHGINLTKINPVDEFVCSECGFTTDDFSQKVYDEDGDYFYHKEYVFKFCPNCGAKMEEER